MAEPITNAEQLVDWLFTNSESEKGTHLGLYQDIREQDVLRITARSAVLAKVEELLASQWRPISEAPKDGTKVLMVWPDKHMQVAAQIKDGEKAFWFEKAPTLFQLLPVPPEGEREPT